MMVTSVFMATKSEDKVCMWAYREQEDQSSINCIIKLLTLPMRVKGRLLIVCADVSVFLLLLAGAMSPLKSKLSYQRKALDMRNKLNVGIELKILTLKVMSYQLTMKSLHSSYARNSTPAGHQCCQGCFYIIYKQFVGFLLRKFRSLHCGYFSLRFFSVWALSVLHCTVLRMFFFKFIATVGVFFIIIHFYCRCSLVHMVDCGRAAAPAWLVVLYAPSNYIRQWYCTGTYVNIGGGHRVYSGCHGSSTQRTKRQRCAQATEGFLFDGYKGHGANPPIMLLLAAREHSA